MNQLKKDTEQLRREVQQACDKLAIAKLAKEHQQLTEEMAQPTFWDNSSEAQEKSKRHARLSEQITPWLTLQANTDEILELIELGDPSLTSDLNAQLGQLQKTFLSLKDQLKFTGQYDRHDAIMTIHAGAGGTDAQDWAEMLLRMYVRWAESEDINASILNESAGDEAGIKSATLELSGNFVFGRLKGEHGVHRLVRQSPFNSDNLRQTSFAMVEVIPKIDQPEEVKIDEKDINVDVYRSGGKGGQSVNTTDSAVRVTHLPTGISVAIQNERSQIQNKETAMTILRSKLAQMQLEQHAEKIENLRGPNTSAEWGNQIRSYVLHPYKQVKDIRTRYETSDPDRVLNGDLNELIESYMEYSLGKK